ncbi:hypothetical protein OG912_05610 [Streptomyces sp. NBC_00464]|uniref:hypothetical protein n=1 Tax=Streptomyces sp. NBC_00464 TaxID=2975751 RepID=UPI002E17FC27
MFHPVGLVEEGVDLLPEVAGVLGVVPVLQRPVQALLGHRQALADLPGGLLQFRHPYIARRRITERLGHQGPGLRIEPYEACLQLQQSQSWAT